MDFWWCFVFVYSLCVFVPQMEALLWILNLCETLEWLRESKNITMDSGSVLELRVERHIHILVKVLLSSILIRGQTAIFN